jgi:hypothetical protein
MDENTSPADLDDNDAAPLSPAEQVRTLVADVRALAEAEIDYAKARLSYSGGIIRKAGIWAFLAIFFLSGAIIALILGLLAHPVPISGAMAGNCNCRSRLCAGCLGGRTNCAAHCA